MQEPKIKAIEIEVSPGEDMITTKRKVARMAVKYKCKVTAVYNSSQIELKWKDIVNAITQKQLDPKL